MASNTTTVKRDPYADLPPVPSFDLESSLVADDETMAIAQRDGIFGSGGQDISPDLSWSGFPDETQSFIVTIYDPDVPNCCSRPRTRKSGVWGRRRPGTKGANRSTRLLALSAAAVGTKAATRAAPRCTHARARKRVAACACRCTCSSTIAFPRNSSDSSADDFGSRSAAVADCCVRRRSALSPQGPRGDRPREPEARPGD